MCCCSNGHVLVGVGSTYPRRLVLGEHSPGVVVEVMFVGGMFCLTESVDKAGRQASGHLEEHFGEGESWHGRIPARTNQQNQ